jgi:hypothetical protein
MQDNIITLTKIQLCRRMNRYNLKGQIGLPHRHCFPNRYFLESKPKNAIELGNQESNTWLLCSFNELLIQ